MDNEITLELEPCETRVLSVRKNNGLPQIVSTSRHITQGAAEIVTTAFENNSLYLKAYLVKGDEYKVALYIPEKYKLSDSDAFKVTAEGDITYLSFVPDETKEYEFKIKFN